MKFHLTQPIPVPCIGDRRNDSGVSVLHAHASTRIDSQHAEGTQIATLVPVTITGNECTYIIEGDVISER